MQLKNFEVGDTHFNSANNNLQEVNKISKTHGIKHEVLVQIANAQATLAVAAYLKTLGEMVAAEIARNK